MILIYYILCEFQTKSREMLGNECFSLSTKIVIFSFGKKLGEFLFWGSSVNDINLAIFQFCDVAKLAITNKKN